MPQWNRWLPRQPLLALMLSACSLGAFTRAQDDWDAAERDELGQPNQWEQQAGLGIDEETLDLWIFGNRDASQGLKRLDALLKSQVESIDRVCSLSDAQKEKLLLAGRGDIKRFLDSVEEVEIEFEKARRDPNNINQIWVHIQPLQMKLSSSLYDDASLFRKVLSKTLDTSQIACYEQQEAERRSFRYEAKVASAIATLENGVPLRDQQRQKLTALLVGETLPPKKYGQYDYYVVLYQAAKLPEEQLKPIFDDAQWRAVQQAFGRAERMEATLRRNGLIP